MPPPSTAPGGVRPAAAVNEEIRALARAAWGRPFTDVERAAYDVLVTEWAEADSRERQEAAAAREVS